MMRILAVSLMLLISSTAISQPEADVQLRFEEYMAVFNAQDSERIARQFLSHPMTIRSGESVTTLNSVDESLQFMAQYFSQLKQLGWTNSIVRATDVCAISDAIVFLDNEYSRLKSDGTAIEPAVRRTLQVWQRVEGEWRIAAFYFHDEDIRVGCNK